MAPKASLHDHQTAHQASRQFVVRGAGEPGLDRHHLLLRSGRKGLQAGHDVLVLLNGDTAGAEGPAGPEDSGGGGARDVLERGEGFGWDPPSSQGPPMAPAEGEGGEGVCLGPPSSQGPPMGEGGRGVQGGVPPSSYGVRPF